MEIIPAKVRIAKDLACMGMGEFAKKLGISVTEARKICDWGSEPTDEPSMEISVELAFKIARITPVGIKFLTIPYDDYTRNFIILGE